MPTLKISSATSAPEGKHRVTLEEVREIANTFYNATTDPSDKETQFEWIFSLVNDPSTQLHAWSSVKLSMYKGTPSKALRIVEALVGRKVDGKEREEFSDTNTLLGKHCVVEVEHITNRNGELRSKIVDFQRDDSSEKEESKKMPF